MTAIGLVLAVVAIVVPLIVTSGGNSDASPGGSPRLTYVVQRLDPDGADDFWAVPTTLTTKDLAGIPAAGSAFHDWIRPHGGIQVGGEFTRIELTNPGGGQVRIVGLAAKVTRSAPAPTGSLFCGYSQGNGQINKVEINLTDPAPQARQPDGSGTGDLYFADNGDITLDHGETITLTITALPQRGMVTTWSPVVRYTTDGGPERSLTIVGPEPFQVSDKSALYNTYLQSAGKDFTSSVKWTLPEGRYERVPAAQC
jgi:hypothetical protein